MTVTKGIILHVLLVHVQQREYFYSRETWSSYMIETELEGHRLGAVKDGTCWE